MRVCQFSLRCARSRRAGCPHVRPGPPRGPGPSLGLALLLAGSASLHSPPSLGGPLPPLDIWGTPAPSASRPPLASPVSFTLLQALFLHENVLLRA